MSVTAMAWAWRQTLPPNGKIVLVALADHAHDDGTEARPTLELLSVKTGYGRRQVQRILAELVRNGVIYVQREAGWSNGRGATVYGLVMDNPITIGRAGFVVGGAPPDLRVLVIARDERTCQLCREQGDEVLGPDGAAWEVDRIDGFGRYVDENVRLSCRTCNRRRGRETEGRHPDVPTGEGRHPDARTLAAAEGRHPDARTLAAAEGRHPDARGASDKDSRGASDKDSRGVSLLTLEPSFEPSFEPSEVQSLGRASRSTDPGGHADAQQTATGTPPSGRSSTPATTRGHRLPEDWRPTPELVAEAAVDAPDVDQDRECRRFRDYWLGASGKTAIKVRWDTAYRNWMRKAQDDHDERHPRGQQQPRRTAADERLAAGLSVVAKLRAQEEAEEAAARAQVVEATVIAVSDAQHDDETTDQREALF